MNRRVFTAVLALLLFTAFQAQAITLKLASLLPEGTEWDRALREMAAEWADITDGRVKLKIYPGGIAGGEADIIRKMRIGQIDMAVLTSVGMTAILPDSFAMSLPFLLESEEELDFIVEEVTPLFDEDFQDKGFVVLAWSKSGWVNIFSNVPVEEPEDLARLRFAGSVTQPEITESFKKMGFNVISVDTTDMLMSLQSGMVDAFYAPPMGAASYQWFALAKNMLDIKICPVIGGIVISERAWKRIASRYHEDLLDAADKMASYFYAEALDLEGRALDVMTDNGLRINHAGDNVTAEWRALMGEDFSIMVSEGGFVSPESYRRVRGMLDDFRSR